MKKKKLYRKPELKVVELSFNTAQMAVCNTPSITTPYDSEFGIPCNLTACPNT